MVLLNFAARGWIVTVSQRRQF